MSNKVCLLVVEILQNLSFVNKYWTECVLDEVSLVWLEIWITLYEKDDEGASEQYDMILRDIQQNFFLFFLSLLLC
jgi:hypothetical protein